MLFNTRAVVVRAFPYGEAHLVVTLLTPSGTVSAMARGAKKPKSKLMAGVQLCTEGVYSVYRGSGMGTIQQVEVTNTRRRLREQLEWAAFAAYFCELVQAVAEDSPRGSEALYRVFTGALDRLAEESTLDGASALARMWEAKVLRLLGTSPDWTECLMCSKPLEEDMPGYSPSHGGMVCQTCIGREAGGQSARWYRVPRNLPRVLQAMALVPWERLGSVRLGNETLEAARRVLRTQLVEYAGLSFKSLRILESLIELS